MKRGKIVYLSDVDISSPGGAQESMKILIDELSSEFDIFLIGPKGNQINENHIVLDDYENFVLRGKGIIEIFFLVRKIYLIIKQIDPDIIHVQMPSTLIIINFLFSIKFLSKKIKIVYTDIGVYGKYGRLTTYSINSLIEKADKVVTTTNKNRENYLKHYRDYEKYKHKFLVIYNTAGKLFDVYSEKIRKEIRNYFEIKKNDLVIGFCGRYHQDKNWDFAYKIIKYCDSKLENIRFFW